MSEPTEPAATEQQPEPAAESTIEEPAKLLRLGRMLHELREELAQDHVTDAASRDRIRHVYEAAAQQLDEALSGALREELESFTLPFTDDPPSEAELRIAQAQLLGWLEGLLQGIQAAMLSQQQDAGRQLSQLRRAAIPGGGQGDGTAQNPSTGQYL